MRLHTKIGALALVLATAGCTTASTTRQPQSAESPQGSPGAGTVSAAGSATTYPAYAAVVETANIGVFRSADASGPPLLTLPKFNENGAPQTFLIRSQQTVAAPAATWYQVLLPMRPNGSSGWIPASQVRVIGLPYRLVVHLASFKLDVFDRNQLVRSIGIGEGTDQTPTPGGLYYIKELLRPPDQNTVYGHYVFGLSGFSNVLVNWPGGGVLGIHGTDDPATSLGQRVSHGCIRMTNQNIEYLAGILPLGTPVTVIAD